MLFVGMRNASVPKMAIVMTDGHSSSSPAAFARRLARLKNVTVVAVAVSPEYQVPKFLHATKMFPKV